MNQIQLRPRIIAFAFGSRPRLRRFLGAALAALASCGGVDGDVLSRPAACVTVNADDPGQCRTTAEWSDRFAANCARSGLAVGNATFADACGSDSFQTALYDCCPAELITSCNGGRQYGETSCKPANLWEAYAKDACIAQGLAIVGFFLEEPCGVGSYRGVSYKCCP